MRCLQNSRLVRCHYGHCCPSACYLLGFSCCSAATTAACRGTAPTYASRETGPIWTCRLSATRCKGGRPNQTTSTHSRTHCPNNGTHLSLVRRCFRSRLVRLLVLPHLLAVRRRLEPSLSPDPTSSSNKEGKRKRKAGASNEVPLSWAEADRQFYASAAGKAYLAAGGTVSPSTAPSSSAASAPSAVRPSVELSEQAVPQLCGVAPACHQPTSLRKKAVPRKFTSEGVEIHHLLDGARGIWDKHVGRRFEALSDAERTQQYRNKAPSSAPTPAPAPPPPLTARSAVVPTSDERSCAHWEAKDARAAAVPPERSAPPAPAPTPAPAIDQSVEPLLRAGTEQHCHAENAGAACDVAAWAAPSTPSGPEASSDVMVKLADLADLTELQDDEAVVALSNHLSPSGHWMP